MEGKIKILPETFLCYRWGFLKVCQATRQNDFLKLYKWRLLECILQENAILVFLLQNFMHLLFLLIIYEIYYQFLSENSQSKSKVIF